MSASSNFISDNREPIFYPQNVPPGPERGGRSTCPIDSFSIIKICARLAETNISKDEDFCGKNLPSFEAGQEKNYLNPIEGIRTDCLRIWARLYVISRGVEGKPPFPPQYEYDSFRRVFSILGDQEYCTLHDYSRRVRPNILNMWKGIIWEKSHVLEGENHHFRTIRSPEEISDQEAVSYVQNITKVIGDMFNKCPKHP